MRLTVYFAERARIGRSSLADRLLSLSMDSKLHSAVLLRGGEGFGPEHGLTTARQLTLSEDLPMVFMAFDSASGIDVLSEGIRSFLDEGLMTIEPAAELGQSNSHSSAQALSRLTIWTGRQAMFRGSPARIGVVDYLKGHGAQAAVALLGIDGIADGTRRRGRFFSANRQVPILVVGVIAREKAATLQTELAQALPGSSVEISNIDQSNSAQANPGTPSSTWKMSVFSGGTDRASGIRRQREVVRMLRSRGAPGASLYLGIYGF
ncbi:MAG: DUF190 domain-containing protein, partial [Solirubrobacterales bacterium]